MKAGNHNYHTNMINTNTNAIAPPLPQIESKANANHENKNPYVQYSPVSTSNPPATKRPLDMMLDTLNQCGKMVEGASRKADTIADNVWNHLRMSPSLADAAMARLNHRTKMLTRGDDKVFQQTFGDVIIGEKLLHSYACYLSTSIGPVIGVLYISNKRIAFCSDFSHYFAPRNPNRSYYKVVVQLDQLRSVNPSANRWNPSEKYIHIATRDGHDFWFMGFIYYDKALMNLSQVLVELYNPK